MPEGMAVSARGTASAERVWGLLASPAAWPAWAPHMAHVCDPGTLHAPSRVHVGQQLHLQSILPHIGVDVTVTDVREGESWTMRAPLRVGELESGHSIAQDMDTTLVTVTLRWHGPRPIGVALLNAYRPVATFAIRRLLQLAEAEAQGAALNRMRMCHLPPLPP